MENVSFEMLKLLYPHQDNWVNCYDIYNQENLGINSYNKSGKELLETFHSLITANLIERIPHEGEQLAKITPTGIALYEAELNNREAVLAAIEEDKRVKDLINKTNESVQLTNKVSRRSNFATLGIVFFTLIVSLMQYFKKDPEVKLNQVQLELLIKELQESQKRIQILQANQDDRLHDANPSKTVLKTKSK